MLKSQSKIERFFTLSLVITSLFYSCKKNDVIDEPQAKLSESDPMTFKPTEQDVTVLGERRNNPYSVANMKKAFASLNSRARISEEANTVRTTHLYVRFLPSDWPQYDELKRDTSLTLYNIPLDYEVEKQGSNYHDPSIAADKPTWQYTSVPVDFKFNPNIKYEIISECYIPEYDTQLEQISSTARISSTGKTLTDQLIDEAMIVSGNPNDTLKLKGNAQRVAWHPSGRVTCLDTRLNQMIGLHGVKIIVRRWIIAKVREEKTDYYGDYYFEDFNRPVSYCCVFETDQFDIRSGSNGQVQFDGPKSSSPWNLEFWADDLNRFYCDVFRGARRYHYGEMGGIRRPGLDFKLKYACRNERGVKNGKFKGLQPVGFINDIEIWRFYSNGEEKKSDAVFSYTIHETAHASHDRHIRNNTKHTISDVSIRLAEAWAVAVQWYITSMEYQERKIFKYGAVNYTADGIAERLQYGFQWWNKDIKDEGESDSYSPFFIDLVDDFNQKDISFYVFIRTKGGWGNYTGGINDPIKGYSMSYIENNIINNILYLHTTDMADKLKLNKPAGVTNEMIDNYISQY